MGISIIPKTQIFVQELNKFFNAYKTAEANIFATNITFPANDGTESKIYTLEVYANDVATGISIPLTVYPKSESISYYEVVGVKTQTNVIGSDGSTIEIMVYFKLDNPFIPVTNIDGLPTDNIMLANEETYQFDLKNCKTDPLNATNQTIEWNVVDAGNTGAIIEGDLLKLTNIGIASIKATIKNGTSENVDFIKECNITLQPVAVEDITGLPKTFQAEQEYVLTATVTPDNARNKNIVWSVVNAGNTGAIIENNTLLTTDSGEVTIKAEIENGISIGKNYTKEFVMTAEHAPHISVTDIIDLPTEVGVGDSLTLTGTVTPDNAKHKDITWSIISDSGTSAVINGNVLSSAIAVGTVTVRATIAGGTCTGSEDLDYTKDFNINVVNAFVPVKEIYSTIEDVIPLTVGDGVMLKVSTILPTNTTASKNDVTWSIPEDANNIYSLTSLGGTYTQLEATAPGSSKIRATINQKKYNNSYEDYVKDFDVIVSSPTFIPATKISSNQPVSFDMTVGETKEITASVVPSDANVQVKNIEWKSNDPSVCEIEAIPGDVNNKATITAIGAGTVTLVATIKQNSVNNLYEDVVFTHTVTVK